MIRNVGEKSVNTNNSRQLLNLIVTLNYKKEWGLPPNVGDVKAKTDLK